MYHCPTVGALSPGARGAARGPIGGLPSRGPAETSGGRPWRGVGYGVAILSTLLVLLVRWLLWPILGDTSPFVLFFLSVFITARFWGPGPGALATVLGAAAGFYFFTGPRYTFILGEPRDLVRLLLFFLVAGGTLWISWLHERADKALQQSNERLKYLLDIARDLLSSDRPAQYVESLCLRLVSLLGLDLYLFHVKDGDGKTLCLASHAGLPAEALEQMTALSIEESALADTTRWSRGRVFPSGADSCDPHAALASSLGATAYAVYPLVAHEQLIGSLAFGARGRPAFAPDELSLLETVCDQVAIAVDRAHLISALRDRAHALLEGDRHKNEFLAMLAHELRNPLAPMRAAVEVMRLRDTDRDVLERNRAVLERQVVHMARLLDDLLDMSRISRGKVRLRRERVDLTPILESAVEASRPLIRQRGHELRFSLPKEPVWVNGDATRLHQVVTNLLTNAAKYTDPGGRNELSAWREGEEAVICVRDTGIGISPEMLPRIFELFTQSERALHRSEGGLGIGLSLVHSLVEIHGGRVVAESDGVGHGSRFTVRLPVTETPAVGEPSGRGEPAAAGLSTRAHPSGRILIVDDNRDATETLAELLEVWGFEPVAAYDAGGGLERLRSTHPQAVLLDVGLPDMDGYDLARRIRSEAGGDGLLLIALTGYGQEEDRQRSRAAGIDYHLTKPVDGEHLRGLLMRHGCDGTGKSGGAEAPPSRSESPSSLSGAPTSHVQAEANL